MQSLINQLDFDPANPFDINQDPFCNFKPHSFKHSFAIDLYRHHWEWVWEGELRTSLVYAEIAKNIRAGLYQTYLDDLSAQDIDIFCNYFEQSVAEEMVHHYDIQSLLEKIYGAESIAALDTKENKDRIKKEIINDVVSADLVSILIEYYVGECYHWCVFYNFYNQTTNAIKKDILHKFMTEEAEHHNNIYQLIKKIVNKINTPAEQIIGMTRLRKYFGFDYVTTRHNVNDVELLPRDQVWLALFCNNTWQRNFNDQVLKKIYRMYDLLHPGITLDQFKDMINHNTAN